MNEQRTVYLAAKSIDVVQEFEDATGLSTRAGMDHVKGQSGILEWC